MSREDTLRANQQANANFLGALHPMRNDPAAPPTPASVRKKEPAMAHNAAKLPKQEKGVFKMGGGGGGGIPEKGVHHASQGGMPKGIHSPDR